MPVTTLDTVSVEETAPLLSSGKHSSRHSSHTDSSDPESVTVQIDPYTSYHSDGVSTNKLILPRSFSKDGRLSLRDSSYQNDRTSFNYDKDAAADARSFTSSVGSVTSRYSRQMSRLMKLSFAESEERITLTWEGINVYAPPAEGKGGCPCCRPAVETDPEYKHILRDVSGAAKPGTLLAILGASGAGKTTLLNVLTYRNRGKLLVSGSVKVNGGNVGSGMASLSAYVQQDDLFIGTLKVKEHLWFQSQLRIDKEIPQEVRAKRVDAVMQEMGLVKCADTYIGIPGKLKGISGGEKKRLAVASEVLTNPPLMFLDEPTSGLDSFMAQNIVQTLKNMASKGRTILCTIHQPSSETFELFDRVLLVANGRTAYLGPAKDALKFFKSCGYPSPRNYNPADHYIHTLAMWPGKEDKCRKQIESICDKYEESDHRKDVQNTLTSMKNRDDAVEFDETAFAQQSPYKAGVCLQFKALLWRSWLSCMREPGVFRSRLVQATVLAVIFGATYWQQNDTEKSYVDNINGSVFLMQTQMTFGFVFAVVMAFPAEYPIFLREHHDGMYRVGVYFISKMLAEFPQFLVIPVVFTTIMHWAVGLNQTADAFFINLATLLLVCNCSVSFGYLLSSSSSNVTKVLSIGPIFIVPAMMVGGFYIKKSAIPIWLRWMEWLSWYSYSNEIMIVTQWKDVGYIPGACPVNSTDCFTTGKDIIKNFDYTEDSIAFDFGMMVVLMVGFRLVAFLLLYIRSRNRFTNKR